MTRERRRSDAVNETRRVAAAAVAGEAGKGADNELQRRRLPGNGRIDAREGGCTNWRALRVPTASRSTAENSVELNVDRNDGDERRGGGSAMKKNGDCERGERGEREGFGAAAYDAAHGGPWMLRSAAGRRNRRRTERRSSGDPRWSPARSGRCSGLRLGREAGEEGEDVDGAGGQVRRTRRLRWPR